MPIAFTKVSEITGGSTTIAELKNPTSLQFGPDGRLYVSEQNGTINAFTVELQNGVYVKTAQENIKDASGNEIIKNLQNHNDDGTDATQNNRQVTGIAVTGTPEEPVLYISSSDPRVPNSFDSGLDTNSGVLSRASFNNTTGEWEVVDLIRGLPRSEENHSVNGILLSEDGTKLLLQVGANTNNGAPSQFFAYTAEYALSTSILEIDLTALDAMPDLVDPNGGKNGTARTYKYDLPTLDDPNIPNVTDGVGEDANGMDEDGPWGGNDGLNMAILPADAPLRIYADGTRNAYDLTRTANGQIFTVDNGGNGTLGSFPNTETGDEDGDGVSGEAISTPNDGGAGEGEPLFQVVEGGYYHFANPVRSNQNQSWTVYGDDGLPDGTVGVNTVADISTLVPAGVNIEAGYLIDPSKYAAGLGQTLADLSEIEQTAFLLARGQGLNRGDPAAGALTILGSSTNGIVAYDSGGTAFNGVLDGALFVTQFNSNLTLLNVNAMGTGLDPVPTEGADGIFGTADDGVVEGGEDGVLEIANASTGAPLSAPLDVTVGPDGTLWVAEHQNNRITVLAPTEVSAPADTDTDDDGIENVDDPFQRDAANGTGVVIAPGQSMIWDFDDDSDDNLQGPSGFATGLTGAAINGVTDFEQFFLSPSTRPDQVTQLDNVKFATAAGGGTTVVEFVSQGEADGAANSGEFLFHTGLSLAPTVSDVVFDWTMINPANPDAAATQPITGVSQQIGGYIGTGDQSNFLKMVAVQTGPSTSGFQILLENGDTTVFNETLTDSQVDVFDTTQIPNGGAISISLAVDVPGATAIASVTYQTTQGDRTLTGSVIDLTGTAVLDVLEGGYQVQGQDSGLAVGLYSSNAGQLEADAFQAVFDDITVTANSLPAQVTAGDDTAATTSGTTIVIPVADLLANDLPADGSLDVTGAGNAFDGTVSLNDAGTPGDASDDSVVFTPDFGFVGNASFEYTVSNGTDSDTGAVDVQVDAVSSAVLYRVNAGGPLIASVDGGPDWSADTQADNSPYLVSAGSNGVQGYALPFATTILPQGVPRQLFLKERFDQPSAPSMQWAFDVAQPSAFYEVKLYLRNGFDGTGDPGERIFDVAVEGSVPATFDDLDPTALFGHKVGGVVSTVVEVTDGTLDLEFLHGVQNPIVNAIEVSSVSGPTPVTVSIASGASISVNEGEVGGTAFVSVTTDMPVPPSESVTIDFEIVPGTATPGAGNDYEYTGVGATFNGGVYTHSVSIAGSSSDVQIPVSILQDMDVEPGETFTVRLLSVSSNAVLGTVSETTVTIEDDDSPVVVTLSGDPAVSVNEAAGQIDISIVTDQVLPAGSPLDVTLEVTGGTATPGAGGDFSVSGGTLGGSTYTVTAQIPGGTDTVTLPIDILQDTGVEPNETFTVSLVSVGANAVLGSAVEQTVTIIDDDTVYTPPADTLFGNSIEISDDRLAPTDGGMLSLGDNLVTATQEGESGENGIRDRDYFTFTIPDGHQLTGIFLDDFVNDNPLSPNGFLAVQQGTQITVDPVTGDPDQGADPLLGAVVYGSGDVTTDLLATMAAGGVVDPSTGFTLPGFSTPLTGDIAVWLNQGAGPGAPTLRFVTEAMPPVEGGILYRVNAGGELVASIDDGPDWTTDTATQNSVYLTDPGSNSVSTPFVPASADLPSDAPAEVFESHRADSPSAGTMKYAFDVPENGFYTVRLFMRNSWNGADDPGERVFDVAVEGTVPAAFDDLDPTALFGHKVGGVAESTVEVTDGTLNLEFVNGISNPLVNAIEVLSLTGAAPLTVSIADGASISVAENVAGGTALLSIATDMPVPASESVTVNFEIVPGTATPGSDYEYVGGTLTGDIYTGSVTIAGGSSDVQIPVSILQDMDVEPDEAFTVRLTSVSSNAVLGAVSETEVTISDDDVTPSVGEAELSVNRDQNSIEASNYNTGSFEIFNSGTKAITSIEIDVTDALFPDTVFDPFGVAGDTINKVLTIDSEGGTGVLTPTGGFDQPSAVGVTYFGAGGTAGFERIRLEFTDFDPGETLTFSIDMDPNSVAGAAKLTLDSGAVITDKPGDDTWDVGGVGGAEISHSLFSVTFDDATESSGRLIGQGTGQQIGARAIASQSGGSAAVSLTVNGLTAGSEGTYGAGGPAVTVQGPAGETARILLAKGFIVPFENLFPDTADPNEYHDQLDAQLATLAASGFPANNAAELQYVDVLLDGTVQDVTASFDFTDVDAFTIPSAYYDESRLPLGFTGSVIDVATDLPKGPVTAPIHLTFDDPAPNAPTIAPIADVSINETDTVNVTVTATDPDGNDTVMLDVAVTDPLGATVPNTEYSFTDNGDGTADFSWVTPDVQSEVVYDITFIADDGISTPAQETFSVTVNDTSNPAEPPFLPNSSGDIVIDVNEMDGGDANGWTFRTNVTGATGGTALSWDGDQSFGSPANGQLSYSFTPDTDGIYYFSLRSLSEKGPKTDHNDAFARITTDSGNEIIPRDGYKQGQLWTPSFTGHSGNFNDGWYKVYQYGAAVDEWAYSNRNVDTVGIPLGYELTAGETYVAQVAARSNMYVIDQLHLAYQQDPPNVDPNAGALEVTQPIDPSASAELSERGFTGGGGSGAPSIMALPDLTVYETAVVDVDIVATDPDGNSTINLDIEVLRPNGLPANANKYTFTDNGDGTAGFIWNTPQRNNDGTFEVIVTADDGDNPPVVESFDVTVLDGTPPAGSDEIIFRVNAGGDLVAAEDSGPDWTADTASANSVHLTDAGSNSVAAPNVPASATLSPDAPAEVYESHRWDRPAGSTMEYAFDVPDDGFYSVRLFIRNNWNGANDPGERVFDVALEGTVPSGFDGIDPTGLFGHKVGGVVESTVEVSDGTLNVEFLNDISNPIVNAIEIVATDDPFMIG
ncbi:malectin domain-containing carbohydrate-binding protein [Amaricoccus tamworthensis]|uniref:malectin domain-containing carbohydrate-binding protein n=1 Tax=Amaricoccus tamworthensis TaxID=57002 RepID=UPI003C7B1347